MKWLPNSETEPMKRQKKYSGLRIGLYIFFLSLALVLSGGAYYSIFVEPDRLILVQETIRIPGLPDAFDGFRIAVMSDFHLTKKAKDLALFRRAVALANAQSPDAVFLLGDFVEGNIPGHGGEIGTAGRELGKLKAPDGIFAVMGNHDRILGIARLTGSLEQNGIVVLKDSCRTIRRGGHAIHVVGLAESKPDNNLSSLPEVPPDEPVFLLSHYPDRPLSVKRPVTLSFTGHTHGGQIVLPLIGALAVYSKYGLLRGFEERKGRRLFISSGIGTSLLRIRYGVPPEVVLITLKK